MKYIALLSVLIIGCATPKSTSTSEFNAQLELTKQLEGAVLWYQNSAEMRLSYYQAYQYARLLMDDKLANDKSTKPPAVVLDIDETVLDNSPYEAILIDKGETFTPKTWKEWTDEARAEALPGALEFTKYAKSRGVEVIYISNRMTNEMATTIANLKSEQFPNAEEQYVLLNATTSDKTERRNKVMETYNVLVYIGDNLTDFSETYSNRGLDMGKKMVDDNLNQLLNSFVMLPNPMYGEWEKAIYDNNYGISDEIKLQKRKAALKR
ncbi:MAG TPA: 5'-nucleotidase, lipoprotein e(P4) family [Fulvivirga sp.]|nr:5'-nucleotidase, lipoprotein e(P4) family [Fulvivirga sp.]